MGWCSSTDVLRAHPTAVQRAWNVLFPARMQAEGQDPVLDWHGGLDDDGGAPMRDLLHLAGQQEESRMGR